ncbi:MAG TPA: hypothetical protein OIM04_11425 [Oscillospiraceae bacterium]|nr:hypothetical protein [Oscillospiraceae bacterium]
MRDSSPETNTGPYLVCEKFEFGVFQCPCSLLGISDGKVINGEYRTQTVQFCSYWQHILLTLLNWSTTMRPFCPQFEIFRLEKNAMLTLEWIGKNKVVNHHQEVSFRVLERRYSFDEQGQHTENNDSENMIIHGDNLEALKALLPQYEGKVKCIYIVILTPILMSILSSENAVRLNFIIHIMFLALFEMRNYNVLCGGVKWTI